MSDFDYSSGVIETQLAMGGYISVTKGNSMRPLFKTNRDVITLKRPISPPSKYDVVLYCMGSGKYVLHRIIRVRDDVYIIRGDNTYKKEYIPKDRILAVLTEFKRKGKDHKVTDLSYILYSRIWNFIYPLRHIAYHCYALLARVYRKAFGKKNKE